MTMKMLGNKQPHTLQHTAVSSYLAHESQGWVGPGWSRLIWLGQSAASPGYSWAWLFSEVCIQICCICVSSDTTWRQQQLCKEALLTSRQRCKQESKWKQPGLPKPDSEWAHCHFWFNLLAKASHTAKVKGGEYVLPLRGKAVKSHDKDLGTERAEKNWGK